MGRKKEHEEEHVDETWLLPYSDMLTLLLALFIVMFAMSKVDTQKAQRLSNEFNMIVSGGSGMMKGEGNGITEGTGEGNALISEQAKGVAEQDQMVGIKNQLEENIKKDGYAGKINVNLNGEGLNISIQDTVIFNSGEANILTKFEPSLLKIAGMIKDLNNEIRISGYTDNVPIYNENFRSNWDLSYARASNVMRFLINWGNVNPSKFSLQAYGEYKPKYSNSTEEGRSKNRSVDILLVRRYTVTDNHTNSTNKK